MAYNPNNPNGSATSANSAPVVIASDQAAIPITDNAGSITVDGTVTANAGTGTFNTSDANAVGQSSATAAQKGYLSLAGATATLPTYTAGNTNAMTMTTNGLLRVDGSNVTQPVSGPLTDTQLRATAVPISGTVTANAGTGTQNVSVQNASLAVTGTFFQATQPISGTVDTELPAAAALADGAANPTTPTIGAAGLIYNGTTWDRAEGANVLDGNAATTLNGVLSVKNSSKRLNPAALGTATNSAVSVDVNGSNNVTVSISTTTTGTFVIEGTGDNTNWNSVEVYDIFADLWVSGQSLTPTAGKVYSILAGGLRQVRIRTNATLGATVTNLWVLDNTQEFIAGIDTGAAPHNFGYNLVHKDGEYSTAQTTTALWTPTTGKRFAVTDITISTGGTTSGIVTIYDAAAATAYSAGTTPAIFRGEFSPSATAKPGMVKSFNVPYYSAAINNRLHVTTSAAMTVYIQVNGYEI